MDALTPYPFAAWHDFYALLGSASATLVGLMFVAASVGSGVFTAERQVGLRTFLSPTVVAFSVVLGVSLITMMPVVQWRLPGLLLVATGLLGMAYSWFLVWRRMVREGIAKSIDHEDRAWYVIVPFLAYVVIAMAGTALGAAPAIGRGALAGGVGVLLLAGVRNAWDMTTWVILKLGK